MADFMKQRIAAGVLLLAAVFLFCSMAASSKQTAGIRVKAPEAEDSGAQYYYESTVNPFYPELAPYYEVKGGYITGNCTWYAWGRACEIAGRKLPHVFLGDAGTWWETNQKEGWYPYGSSPKRGAFACYETHVGIVEQVEPLLISESGWGVEKQRAPVVFHCGKPWHSKPKGYIYPEE